MSKPNLDGLGICAELTLHEKALRKAQHEMDELRAENARLVAENNRLKYDNDFLRAQPSKRPEPYQFPSPMVGVERSFEQDIQG